LTEDRKITAYCQSAVPIFLACSTKQPVSNFKSFVIFAFFNKKY